MTHDLLRKFAKLAIAALSLGMIVGCAASARTGADFDPTVFDRTLQRGTSTQADVRAALGEPFAKGSAMMPFQDRPRVTWTYFADRSSVSMGSGKMEEKMKYLFVFFDGDQLDSYLWFDSTMQ